MSDWDRAKSYIICALHEYSPDGPIEEGTDLSAMAEHVLEALTSNGQITLERVPNEAALTKLKSERDALMRPQPIETAPTDGTHIIGLTQWGWCEVWYVKDLYEGEFWQDHGDSEPAPEFWIPKPEDTVGDVRNAIEAAEGK